ncbi:MAG TPA: hypothetical protein VGZ27_05270 [Vicinamibacterales bacterium]|nr:hypothetical protein [Vicinamibacterales bacterium]
MTIDQSLRDRVSRAVSEALRALPVVLAGWEGGSAAFRAVDGYSDIDLTYLVEDGASSELLYGTAQTALEIISPIATSHTAPPGRYYKLQAANEFLFVDLCFVRVGAADHFLEVERHGRVVPIFDKGNWLRRRPLDEEALATKRLTRYRELHSWFPVSQSFVRKAILRGRHAEAVTAFWDYTMKPLAELLRMRYCPARWDFGMRYLDRDLPPAVYERVRDLAFVKDLDDLDAKHVQATTWASTLLHELEKGAIRATSE